jgi:hypothetical protein
MAMQDIWLKTLRETLEFGPGHEIERGGFPPDSKTMDTKLHARRDLGQRLLGALASGQIVGDDPDLMAALGLAIGEVEDVTKNAANGCAHRVQDTKRLTLDHWHGQAGALTALRQRNCKGADVNHTMSARTPCIGESRRIIAAD